jgi:hypothetical protein
MVRLLTHRKHRFQTEAASTAAHNGQAEDLAERTMRWSLRKLIASLRADATDPYQNLVPDGVVDLSRVINPLVGMGSTGRVVNEFEEYNLGRYAGELLQRILPTHAPTSREKDDAILVLIAIHIQSLREAVRIKPDLSIDEILSAMYSDESIRRLQDEFKVVPVRESPAGDVRPLFGIMKIFSQPVPRTIHSILGPAIRKIGKLDLFIREQLGEFKNDPESDENGPEPETDDDWDDDESTEDDN